MASCLVVRHVAFEELDLLQPVLAQRGYDIQLIDAPWTDFSAIDPLAADLMVILGGPIGVYDDGDFPFLRDEIQMLRHRLAADRPTLGICLGAQLMASALGARVYPNPAGKEIGWSPLTVADHPIIAPLADCSVLHWHGDTFDLPPGARHLASTAITPNQAFLSGRGGLGLQFHVEASSRGLERWYVGHVGEISAIAHLSVAELRAQADQNDGRTAAAGAQMIARWLDSL